MNNSKVRKLGLSGGYSSFKAGGVKVQTKAAKSGCEQRKRAWCCGKKMSNLKTLQNAGKEKREVKKWMEGLGCGLVV